MKHKEAKHEAVEAFAQFALNRRWKAHAQKNRFSLMKGSKNANTKNTD